MLTTGKWQCREVINLLPEYGVKHVVLSPGTRDTPLIMAAVRHPSIEVHSVIDERSAAFIAYGMSKCLNEPVAVVCTSGSAVLNLTPAVSEAYYAHVPLIVVTADRPSEWIDQDDSQTIRQQRLMQDFTVGHVNVPCHCHSAEVRSAISRDLNVALSNAVLKQGPVHINVEIDEPIAEEVDIDITDALSCRKININVPTILSSSAKDYISDKLSEVERIMLVGGFDSSLTPSQKKILDRFASMPNVVFFAEQVGNYPCKNAITMIDEALVAIKKNKKQYYPELVITFGGSLISRSLKEFLREAGAEHWMVGHHDAYPDCFNSLKEVYPDSDGFIEALENVSECESDYASEWDKVKQESIRLRREFMANPEWSDLSAIDTLCRMLPKGWDLQLSNGMTARYAMGADLGSANSVSCNRGVSGIDGSFSTAVGASAVCGCNTLLITGDMSAQYDMGAMASLLIDSRLRVAVMMNGGGEIFRFIRTTCSLPELDQYIAARANFPAEKLAEGFGFKYLKASSADELAEVLPEFFGESDRPVLLAIHTDGTESARIFHDYYKIFKKYTL